jgi:hypothetical protein
MEPTTSAVEANGPRARGSSVKFRDSGSAFCGAGSGGDGAEGINVKLDCSTSGVMRAVAAGFRVRVATAEGPRFLETAGDAVSRRALAADGVSLCPACPAHQLTGKRRPSPPPLSRWEREDPGFTGWVRAFPARMNVAAATPSAQPRAGKGELSHTLFSPLRPMALLYRDTGRHYTGGLARSPVATSRYPRRPCIIANFPRLR